MLEDKKEIEEEKDFAEAFSKNQDNKYKEKIENIIMWKYPHKDVINLPTKTSVTKIKELENVMEVKEQTKKSRIEVEEVYFDDSNEAANDGEKIFESGLENKKVRILTQSPKFLNEEKEVKVSSARKGTLMHLCVQKMNEKTEYDAQKVQELIDELAFKNIISEEEKKAINVEKILMYTKSDLWREISKAKEVYKEKPFYITVKASSLYDINGDDENILVQGVIDLYFINEKNELVLVDYKTDYVEAGKENTLVEKYKPQLNLYKEALEQALNRKVDKVEIYSLYLNKEVEL